MSSERASRFLRHLYRIENGVGTPLNDTQVLSGVFKPSTEFVLQVIGDQFTVLNPIGIGFKLSPKVVLDFETVVATAVHPGGITGLVVDPGVVYDTGPLAIGLRAAWKINAKENFGLIPLFNRALVHGEKVTWFVEAAFPTFISHDGVEFNAVLHTGLGF